MLQLKSNVQRLQNLAKGLLSLSLCFSFVSSQAVLSQAHANEASAPISIEPATPNLLTSEEIQQGLKDMQNKMNTRIERWGAGLTRHDFERVRGEMVLRQNKRVQVCQIFQSVIDETYQSAQANKHRLTVQDRKVVENRNQFIQALGIKDNIIPTKLGFDCRIR